MKKILIAYDGSSPADAVLEELTQAGLPAVLEATVLSVADVWLPSQMPDSLAELPPAVARSYEVATKAVKACQAQAEKAAARLRVLFPEWEIQARACADSPPWAVVKQANDWGADLVVVGGHSHSALQRFFLGSVASKVAAEAHCSVRIARASRAGKDERMRVMVAVDGSHDSVNAARTVAQRFWPAHAEFRVITVLDPKMQTAAAWPEVYSANWGEAGVPGGEEWCGRMIQSLADILRGAGLKADTDIHDGDPKTVLTRQAESWGADCIFLGARGLHHQDRLYVGTLASAVAARAHCSVEIVRTPASS